MKIEMFRRGKGWLPASEDAEKVLHRMEQGEIGWFKPIRVRDLTAHRRYWKLLSVCAENCDRITLPCGASMPILDKDDVHTAMKICTGHVTWIFDANEKPVFAYPKRTDFENMTADEWNCYWPKVLDVVQERILPGIDIPEVENEIQKLMGWAR